MSALATAKRPDNLIESNRPADGNEAWRRENPAEERAQLAQAIEDAPNNGQWPLALGDLEMSLGNFTEALTAYSRAALLLPKSAAAHSGRALVCQKLGRSTEAAQSAIRAVSIDPADISALKVLARIHLDAQQHEAAQQACRLILRRSGQDPEARQMMDEALAQEAKLAENIFDTTYLIAPPRRTAPVPSACGKATLPRRSGDRSVPPPQFQAHPVEWNDEKVRRFWDHMSSSVVGKEEYFSRQVGQGVTNFLAAVCPQALAGAVLDFGCGPGYLLEPMGRVAGGIWGADSSASSLQAAEEKMRGNPRWKGAIETNGGTIPLPDGGFDLITCVETIEHVVEEGLEPMLAELHRLLRRGHGLLLITTPFEERLEMSEVFCPDCGCAFHRWQHVRRFGTSSLSSLVEAHGFATLLCVNLNFSDFQAAEFPVAGKPVDKNQILSRLGKGPHLIWLGKAI